MRRDSFVAVRMSRLTGATLVVGAIAGASLAAQVADVKGSKDHPLVSRYTGSVVIGYDQRQFDSHNFVVGPASRPDITETRWESRKQTVEGKITRLLYVLPIERSALEVQRNYEQALTKAGFQKLYACAREACGVENGLKELVYGKGRQIEGNDTTEFAFSFPKDEQYIAAKLSRPEGDVYVSVYTAIETFDHVKLTENRPVTLVEVVETKPMDSKMVTVDATAMAKDINSTGHVALYGILFDTNSATVKPESTPALQEIAALLKKEAKLTLYVVGHTDNVGGYDANMDLSRRRAAAVVASLTSQHGIAAARLKPAGVGQLAPVAPNDEEAGRAKNRRVELVKQ